MINRFKKYYNVDNDLIVSSPPQEGICYPFDLMATSESNISFDFTTCSGGGSNITVPGNGTVTICASHVSQPAEPSSKWKIFIGRVDDYCE